MRDNDLDKRLGKLMHAAQAGETEAYRQLLCDCEPFIRQIVKGAGMSDDKIDHAVRTTLFTMHFARHTYDRSRSFITWLNAISQQRADLSI